MTYNSLENNTAITTPAEQRNILEVASNLLEDKNAETWSTLLKVKPLEFARSHDGLPLLI